MTWNYRVIRTEHDHGVSFEIHEVYYDKKGSPHMWSADPVRPHGEDLKELMGDLKSYQMAAAKPVLEVYTSNVAHCISCQHEWQVDGWLSGGMSAADPPEDEVLKCDWCGQPGHRIKALREWQS